MCGAGHHFPRRRPRAYVRDGGQQPHRGGQRADDPRARDEDGARPHAEKRVDMAPLPLAQCAARRVASVPLLIATHARRHRPCSLPVCGCRRHESLPLATTRCHRPFSPPLRLPQSGAPARTSVPSPRVVSRIAAVWGTGQDQCAAIKRQLCMLIAGVKVFLDVDDLKDIGALES